MKFSSEGFDLDDVNDVEEVLELSATPAEYKAKGNAHFQQKEYMKAIDAYSAAIENTPGLKGEDLLKLKEEYDERILEESRNRLKDPSEEQNQQATLPDPFTFDHEYKSEMSVYYGNRAAAYLGLELRDEALKDCNIALLFQPNYPKVLIRRAGLHEHNDQTDLALQDAKEALKLEPNNLKYRQLVQRLQKIEDERLEKLKAETLDKLKDLGNSILGNFGLSLDNFQATQDPQTGSYSINFKN